MSSLLNLTWSLVSSSAMEFYVIVILKTDNPQNANRVRPAWLELDPFWLGSWSSLSVRVVFVHSILCFTLLFAYNHWTNDIQFPMSSKTSLIHKNLISALQCVNSKIQMHQNTVGLCWLTHGSTWRYSAWLGSNLFWTALTWLGSQFSSFCPSFVSGDLSSGMWFQENASLYARSYIPASCDE